MPGVIRPYLTTHRYKKAQAMDQMQDDSLHDGSLLDDRCKMIIFKTVQFARLQTTSESAKNERGTDLKELPRPYKLLQSSSAKSVEDKVKISETCLPPVGPPCLSKAQEEG